MFVYEHSLETSASPERLWALYADVPAWTAWDRGLDRVEIDGPLAAGSTGRITPSGMEVLPFTVTWAEEGRGFTDETPAMGHVLRFTHLLDALPGGGTRVTHRVEVEGPAADEIGPNVTGDTPAAVAQLVAMAEGRTATAAR
jgi:hypothetical protein